jgi:hypothetical protein
MQRIPGPDVLTLLQRQPWHVRSLAGTFAAAHLTIGRCQAPANLPGQREALAGRIDDGPLPAPLRSYAQQVLDDLPDGEQLCHGDFHPGNALVTGDHIGVIDWVNATRGTPASDHARTLLLLRWANPLPGTPALSRALIAAGRTLTTRLYAHAYQAGSPTRQKDIHRWLVVHAAARVSEGIDAETATLVRLIEDARSRVSNPPDSRSSYLEDLHPAMEEVASAVPDENHKWALHRALVDRVVNGEGRASAQQRAQAFRNEGLPPLDTLISKAVTSPAKVTEADFATAEAAGSSEDALFELVVCAAVGRSARLYEAGLAALTEATASGEDK